MAARSLNVVSRSLHRKLARIEALRAGATTEGERLAAEQARDRVLDRLDAEGHDSEGWAEQVLDGWRMAGPSPGASLDNGAEAPSLTEVRRRLEQWRTDQWSRERLQAWAAKVVDRVFLPDLPPDDPQGIAVEVVMQLSTLTQQPLYKKDLPALIAFVDAAETDPRAAWLGWFTYVESVDWEARKRRRRR